MIIGPLLKFHGTRDILMPPTDLNVTNNLFASVLDASMLMLTPRHSSGHTGVKDTSLTSNPEAEWLDMTRTIPHSLAPVLEQLELYQADLVTTARLDELVRAAGIRTATRTVATRLRERGWLLPTGQRGVWEFAPAAVAGAYSRGGHTRLLRSVLVRSDIACGLTFQAAAWALNLADRAPSRIEVAAASARDARRLPKALDVSVFAPKLKYRAAKGVPVLHPTSLLVHMAASPGRVPSHCRRATPRVWCVADLARTGGRVARREALAALESRWPVLVSRL